MSQPPYLPQGGDDPGGERSGSQGWGGADDPTRQFDSPSDGGQREATRQFGQPQYGQAAQPPYGPPTYGQPGQPPSPGFGPPQYGPPQYGQPQNGSPQQGSPQYGSPQYGSAQYGSPQYGSPQYGQPQYGASQYGQAPYRQPWLPPGGDGGPPPKSSRNTVIALIVGAVLVLAAIGAGLFFLLRGSDPTPEASGEPAPNSDGRIPSATVPPDGLGDDPDLDELAQECYSGDMGSCDDLYERAELDSLYALYGGTCAGRQDVSDADTVFCTDAFPGD